MTKTYPGIDYGLGRTNISKSGIRFGVIPAHDVGQSWYDSSEPDYGTPQEFTCPDCGHEFPVSGAQAIWGHVAHCPKCHETNEIELPDFAEPLAFEYDAEGYKASQGSDDCDIFILQSPFFTYAQFCSPCAPGACYLRSPLESPDENNKCFCFGHDWFESGVAPYPVYSVETGELVQPESK